MTSSDKNRPDKHFEQRARELWQEAARQIDPATAGRLRAARRKALEATQVRTHHTVRWLIPTGAFAAIALAAMMVWQPLQQRHATTSMQVSSVADLAADLDNDLPPDADKTDPNLYQNLDFYGWLASSNTNASSPRTNQ
jgi:hypothetical protein